MKSRYLSVLFLVCLAAVLFAASSADAQIWRVDKSATGAGNGTTWQNAFTTIQPAIDAARAAGGGEVWV
ncbi:MAG TPA: right-handed parallel beta-helix repeat-containing protein, partial [Candidatus Hydrogenedentes bacterium]|nr:right-handed parallel beta-helix repeat-containing protein [Candidatus Hydrogenedentota bacterium]